MEIRNDDYLRKKLYDSLVTEIIGPDPENPYKDKDTGEELLLSDVHGSPDSKYGAGILFTQRIRESVNDESSEEEISVDNEEFTFNEEDENNTENNNDYRNPYTSSSDIEITNDPVDLANQYKQCAMGFTFRVKASSDKLNVKIKVQAASYKKNLETIQQRFVRNGEIIPATKNDGTTPIMKNYWKRIPFIIEPISINLKDIESSKEFEIKKDSDGNKWLDLVIVNRTPLRDKEENILTFTVTIINRKEASHNDSHWYLYQCGINLESEQKIIYPYQEKRKQTDTSEEDMLAMLYKKKPVYAIGHGCSAQWKMKGDKVEQIYTSHIPFFEMPQIAPTNEVEISMFNLSDIGNWQKGLASLKELREKYRKWIDDLKKEIKQLDSIFLESANNNLESIEQNYKRINEGIELLLDENDNLKAIKCFQWMNRAMLWQQQRSKVDQRKWIRKGTRNNYKWKLESLAKNFKEDGGFISLKEFDALSKPEKPIGRWRPFQLAFVLMNLKACWDGKFEDRNIVDLIWFPTGGGKTEAYLGLCAFQIFSRRIQGTGLRKEDVLGTSILMRYTLRLLTVQQYERAASLICGCELIREKNRKQLGYEPISIGLWVGGANTPNKNSDGVQHLNHLRQNNNAEYNFIVMKCPCCGAQIGKIDHPTNDVRVKGIFRTDGNNARTYFQCENPHCEFKDKELPLTVVDEEIYNQAPTLVLGTVDKFAMIPWNKEAAKIFGFREKIQEKTWSRIKPPELIIQDELHLISGPLGSMVGMYETMVQSLCNNYELSEAPFLPKIENLNNFIPPKIIASSATISRSADQVKALYGSDKLNIFPPQGLEFGNTWFSQEKEISKESPGRLYIGLCAFPNQSAQTAIARAYARILQKVSLLEDENDIDYYWTLLGFFNSIRELGGASSLIHGDINERLSQIYIRDLITKRRRYLKDTELTSRIPNYEIPVILKELEEKKSIDVCLATNMIATGVDISRLGLMFIHGQPKTTAEYIQASSRVGRDVPKGPGFVVTMYSPSKPRDKSIFEHFQAYHSRIYANVEPTSVTPFTVNVRERALHAVVIALIRHFSDGRMRGNDAARTDQSDFNHLKKLIERIILDRVETIDNNEFEETNAMYSQFIRDWQDKNFEYYGDAANHIINDHQKEPLMYSLGSEVPKRIIDSKSKPTPTSMRGVDSESNISLING